ncbi:MULTISPECIES: MMPL family transporter [Prauserella salsuginis group]|uniref:MMPL family transporter n=1 Tax=Prauserella salsuginis TaxID=387889 RepID=A0ABW6G8U4_9PSEU|nr:MULTISPECIES: MMPL family transporter [Prauserella salsuginis group]MCR3722503.1 putative drug exporter of the RND superfamily [Prauserella flava]MCR3736945.1 putative drug exporter of the RND superfamily [Prauserella salsuginis]
MRPDGHDEADGRVRRRRILRWLTPALLIIIWLIVGGVGGPFAGKLSEVAENDNAAFLPETAESTNVAALERKFTDDESVPAIVVAERTADVTRADRRFLAETSAEFTEIPGVPGELPPPIPSDDGRALQLVVPIAADVAPDTAVEQIRELLASDRPEGLTVLVTGPAALGADLGEAFGGIDGLLLLVAGSVVALILILVYRSPLLPVLVLLSGVFALGLASLVVYLLTDHGVIDLNGQSQGILFILVFGAATDYALLLVSRYREQLRDSDDRLAAMAAAWKATIEPIAASAGTVILGVLCLLFSDLRSNQGLGPVAAIGIGSALVAATTFLPAVLAVFGRSAFWPYRPKLGPPHPEESGFWRRIAARVGSSPRLIWVATTVVLLVGAAFLPQLRASGTAESDVFLNEVDSVAGQEVLSEHFVAGSGSPAVIISDADRVADVAAAAQVDGVSEVSITTGPNGKPRTEGGLTRIEATLSDPADSESAVATVERLRNAVHAVPSADAKVGGRTATLLDTQNISERDRTLIVPIVLVVIFAVLALLLRSLLAPLLLIATVVLSFAATMGVSALVFNHILDFPGADPVVPLFGFVFLVALGIDYNIFLMTRVREETLRRGTRAGVQRGLTVTGGVITSAGVVLAATFAALAVLPILFLAQIAFVVAFGVLLDALIVRSLLVPALAIDIGGRIWWPSRLRERD